MDNIKKYCSKAELEKIEDEIKQEVISAKNSAWKKYLDPIEIEKKQTCEILKKNSHNKVNEIYNNLLNTNPVSRRNIIQATRQAIFYCNGENKKELSDWIKKTIK